MGARITFILLFAALAGLLPAQDTVQVIAFSGDDRSRHTYLFNFIDTREGQLLDTVMVAQDVSNLFNTNLFANVYATTRDTVGGVVLTYVLKEKWSAYPAGNGGIIDENFWVELGWRDNHFIGRGIRTMLLARYYDRFAVRGFFQAPYWFKKGWGMESNWEFGRTFEPITYPNDSVLEFNQDRVFVNLLLSYALQPNNLLYAGFELDELRYTFRDGIDVVGPEQMNEVQTRWQFVLRHHNRHHLDIFEQYVTGWSNEIVLKTAVVGNTVNDRTRWYPFFQNELKLFAQPWNTGNVGSRIRVGVAENDPSVFAQFIQDSFLTTRGIGNKPFRGTAELTGNFELRQTIYDRHWIALQSVAFYDFSTIRPPGDDFGAMFTNDQMYHFAGIGGRIFFKNAFDFILRADYGIGLNSGRHGFVLGLGQYF